LLDHITTSPRFARNGRVLRGSRRRCRQARPARPGNPAGVLRTHPARYHGREGGDHVRVSTGRDATHAGGRPRAGAGLRRRPLRARHRGADHAGCPAGRRRILRAISGEPAGPGPNREQARPARVRGRRGVLLGRLAQRRPAWRAVDLCPRRDLDHRRPGRRQRWLVPRRNTGRLPLPGSQALLVGGAVPGGLRGRGAARLAGSRRRCGGPAPSAGGRRRSVETGVGASCRLVWGRLRDHAGCPLVPARSRRVRVWGGCIGRPA
jgi:hypothetical protein